MANSWVINGPDVELAELRQPFGTYMLQKIRSHGNKILQVDGDTEEEVTGDQLLSRAIAVALELRKRGIGEGDVVSASIDNGLEVSYILFGTLFTGAIYAPINPDLHSDDIQHMVDLLSPRIVFCAPRAITIMRAALKPGAEVVEMTPESSAWKTFQNITPAAVADFRLLEVTNLDGPTLIMGSSGTTGAPKGVMLSHRAMHYLLVMVEKYESATLLEIAKKDVLLLVLSNFWVSGILATLFNVHKGFRMIIFKKFDVDVILGAIEKHQVTSITLSPPHISAIAKHPNVEQYDVSSLKSIGFGGAVLSSALRELAEKRLNKTFGHFYGQTECILATVPGRLSLEKPRSVGCVAMNSSVKIVDPETGKLVAPNVEGEICLKSPMQFTGYYKNSEATTTSLDKDGWVHSGDVGYLDEDGYLFVCDRYKELIKYRGVHISPSDVENVLMSHKAVKDTAVVGIEHDVDQEHPVGFVVRQEGASVAAEELAQFVREQLPVYKQLHGGVYFIDEIPRTATGKIKRLHLRNLSKSLRNEQSNTYSVNGSVNETVNISTNH